MLYPNRPPISTFPRCRGFPHPHQKHPQFGETFDRELTAYCGNTTIHGCALIRHVPTLGRAAPPDGHSREPIARRAATSITSSISHGRPARHSLHAGSRSPCGAPRQLGWWFAGIKAILCLPEQEQRQPGPGAPLRDSEGRPRGQVQQ
jgi:hypothetical protein